MISLRPLICIGLMGLSDAYASEGARQHRSAAAVRAFKKTVKCPSTGHYSMKCPGYIVDHVIALFCGGEDSPANMQYQSVADAKAKDRVERIGCDKPRER